MTDGSGIERLSVEPLERSILEGIRVQGDGEAGESGVADHLGPADLGLLPVFEDERPLQGLTGFLDWRFCGRLSALVRTGAFHGRHGETLLMPGRHGLPVARLVLFGMGPSAALDEGVAHERAGQLFQLAARIRARDVLLALPGELCRRSASEALLERLVVEVRDAKAEEVPDVLGDPAQPPAQPADDGPNPRAPKRWWVVVDARIVSRMRRLVSGPPRAAQTEGELGRGPRA